MIPALFPTGKPAAGGFALIAHGGAVSANAVNVTTAALDTTGANLIVIEIGSYDGNPANVPSDSKSNTWHSLTPKNVGGAYHRLWYAISPTVGTGHTFTAAASSGACYPAISVAAFSGAHASAPFDTEVGTTVSGTFTSFQPGTITPAANGELLIFGWGSYFSLTSSPPYDSGFATLGAAEIHHYQSGVNFTSAMSWNLSSSGAVNPTCGTFVVSSGNGYLGTSVAAFKPA